MQDYLLRRLISLLPVILGVSLITFGLMALVPGDPAEILASHGRRSSPSDYGPGARRSGGDPRQPR